MLKKILAITISIFICFSMFSIISFANNDTTTQPSSSVTIKINMSEKMKSYYAKINVQVASLSEDNKIEKVYDLVALDYNDFIITTTLPNGNYILVSAYIPNDLEHTPAGGQKFTVGEKANVVVEAEVIKDMSAYPDRTTVPQTTESTIPETISTSVEVVTETETISNEMTTSSDIPAENIQEHQLNWIAVIVPIACIIVLGFLIFIIIKKIKENRENPTY